MRTTLAILSLAAAVLVPAVTLAAQVDASLIPDGTYVVKVEKVPDAQHVTVVMQNGVETTLTAKGSVNFAPVHPNQTLKVSVIKGQVPVFIIQ